MTLSAPPPVTISVSTAVRNARDTVECTIESVHAQTHKKIQHVIVDGAYLTPNSGRTYDVSRDGKRFLMIKDATPAPSSARPPSQIAVELNWVDGLRRLVPTK